MDDWTNTSDKHASKRRRVGRSTEPHTTQNPNEDETNIVFDIPKKRLSFLDYDVGWICALDVELAAVRLMLDEEHLPLSTLSSSDNNCYTLGSIGHHNVAIACLPSGVYGKTSAALAAKSMASTFESINVFLLVGVGGGVPQPGKDIRLGDIVVGVPTSEFPAVVQYDYGKAKMHGFIHKGSLDKPHPSLLTAVAHLKSAHSTRTSRMLRYMVAALERYPLAHRFGYPTNSEDVLWEPDCDHTDEDCQCDNTRIVSRLDRPDNAPYIFYGSIASGDQVVENHHVRNSLAREHGILCFEMEAAGLMDQLHPLVIRGICDYCDSKKQKHFQPYAALTAAAYAKELLSEMPARPIRNYNRSIPVPDDILKHRKKILDALKFDTFDSRRANVRSAHSQTCSWFLNDPNYLDWIGRHQTGLALLWLKGKPGTGKSTIMKYLHENIVKNKTDSQIVVAFFFNARGNEMQKSILGLYRSLLFQLFSSATDMQDLLDTLHIDFSSDTLIELFRNCVERLGSRELICFVDALDECSEDQVQDFIDAFESLAFFIDKRTCVRVLFSSRHYPNIVIRDGKHMVLELLPGHSLDIERYIQTELRIGEDSRSDELRSQIFTRSSSIFLWVVLVVKILRNTYARGRVHELSQRLAEIPPGLNDLFRDILIRDRHNLQDLLFLLQWVLYAFQPLDYKMMYLALKIRDANPDSHGDSSNATTEQMTAFVLDCSKGLVKLVGPGSPEVEFIHESVREFLLIPGNLIHLHDDFKAASAERSHRRLRDFCRRQVSSASRYIKSHALRSKTSMQERVHETINEALPLANYSAGYLLHHVDNDAKDSQVQFLREFDYEQWREVYSLTATWRDTRTRRASETFDEYLCNIKAFSLLEARWLTNEIDFRDKFEIGTRLMHREALTECASMVRVHYISKSSTSVSTDHVKPLIEVLADVKDNGSHKHTPFHDLLRLVLNWHDARLQEELKKALYVAMCCKREAAIRLLIAEGGQYDIEGILSIVGPARTLSYGMSMDWLKSNRQHTRYEEDRQQEVRAAGHLLTDTMKCVDYLSNQSLLSHLSASQISSTLQRAIEWTNSDIIAALLNIVVKSRQSASFASALELAVGQGRVDTVQLMLKRRIPVSKYLLHLASRPNVIQCLLEWGFSIDEADSDGNTPLHSAVKRGAGHAVVFLTRAGADPNARNHKGQTPVHYGARRQRPDILVRLLWKHGQVDIADQLGNTSLHEAARYQQPNNIELLLHHGADVDSINNAGRTPFQEVLFCDRALTFTSLLVAKTLSAHGATVFDPSFLNNPQSWLQMASAYINLQGQHATDGTCCNFAGVSQAQIYYSFCVSPIKVHTVFQLQPTEDGSVSDSEL